jgi:uroporphyrinogen-III synthase
MTETIVVTASPGTLEGLAEALREIPARVEERPLLTFSAPTDWEPLDTALSQKTRYRALALTSPRASRAVADRVRAAGLRWNEGAGPQVWAVGGSTMEALQGALGPVRVPSEERDTAPGAAALGRAMLDAGAEGPVLFPCGENHRDDLPRLLRANGVEVDEIVCYRALLADRTQATAAVAGADVLVVASPSVMALLADACPPATRPRLVAIGPTTAASARSAGWPPAAVAGDPSTPAVASAITNLLARR